MQKGDGEEIEESDACVMAVLVQQQIVESNPLWCLLHRAAWMEDRFLRLLGAIVFIHKQMMKNCKRSKGDHIIACSGS